MEKIRLAILGACYSRDVFNSKICPDYKNYFDPVFHQNQISMISLGSSPSTYGRDIFNTDSSDELSAFDKQQVRTEITKNYWNSLILAQPHYIIVDFYGDIVFGARTYKNTWITNKVRKLKKCNIDNSDYLSINLSDNKDEYIEKWKSGVTKLRDFVREFLPSTKIILNNTFFEDRYFDKNNNIASLREYLKQPDFPINEYNEQLAYLNKMFLQIIPESKQLVFDKTHYLDINHIWEPLYVHFENSYYKEMLSKLLQLVISDYCAYFRGYQEKEIDLAKIENVNLLNNYFVNGYFSAWSYINKYYSFKDGVIFYDTTNLDTEIAASWSQAIQLAKTTYDLEFSIDVYASDSVSLENIFLSIRTFPNMEQVQLRQSIEHLDVSLDSINNFKYNEWINFSVILPKFTGANMKFGLSSSENGQMKWRNPKLKIVSK